MLLKDFIKESKEKLSMVYPEKEAGSLLNLVSESILEVQRYTHIVDPAHQVEGAKLGKAQKVVERLVNGEPIQYILGKAHFYGYDFNVTPDVLIPRQETELLCKMAIEEAGRKLRMRKAFGKSAEPVRILDMCTGSGCIAWTIALGMPGVEVYAVDISEEALKVAKGQPFAKLVAEQGGKAPKFSKMDVLDMEQSCSFKPFDIIVSNPPYVMEKERALMKKNVLDHEPELALFVPDEDPLKFYKAIREWSDKLLNHPGVVIMEINEALGRETADLFKGKHGDKEEIIDDIYSKNRFVRFIQNAL
jgi:release factor glutamine methyltransferase